MDGWGDNELGREFRGNVVAPGDAAWGSADLRASGSGALPVV